MRLLIFLVAGALSFFALTGAAETQSVKTALHPLIGKWQWTRTENKCTEVYDFKADGTVPVTSGEEKTENTYRVSPEPDSGGFYQLTLKVNKDFGGKDCSDSDEDSTGQESTTYILFEPSKSMYIDCAEPKPDRCFGPLRRVEE